MEIDKKNVGKMETQLKHWGSKLDDIVAKAETAGAEVKTEYHKHIDDLKAKHKAAQLRLNELKTSGGEKWETVKSGFESAWNELDLAFKKLTNDSE